MGVTMSSGSLGPVPVRSSATTARAVAGVPSGWGEALPAVRALHLQRLPLLPLAVLAEGLLSRSAAQRPDELRGLPNVRWHLTRRWSRDGVER